jgi:hypothetical protein
MKKVSGSFWFVLGLSFFMMLSASSQSSYAAGQDTPAIAQAGTQENAPPAAAEKQDQAAKSDKGRTKHPILMYLPNRIFDLLDIFRIRVRVGPGISAGVRATKPLSAFVGFHSTLFVGLHGPRGKAEFPWPVGIENRGGAQASLANLAPGNTYYGPLEVGAEVQPLIVGINIGVEPFELVDFAAGFLCIDLQDDDF